MAHIDSRLSAPIFSSEISSCFGRVGEFVFFFFFIHAVVCFIEMIIKGERLGRVMDAPAEGSGRIFGHMGQALQLLHFFRMVVMRGKRESASWGGRRMINSSPPSLPQKAEEGVTEERIFAMWQRKKSPASWP